MLPSSSVTSTSTVGLPRLSRIWRAWTVAIAFDALDSMSARRQLRIGADTAVAFGLVGAVGAAVFSSHEAVMTVTINCTGQYLVDVRNPQPGGGVSKTLAFNVVPFTSSSSPTIDDPAFNSAPTLGLFPPVAPARSPNFTLTITGSNFQPGAVVSFGSAVLFPALVTSTTITVTVPAYLVTQPGLVPVVVTNPTGGSSNRVLFGVN